MYRIFLADDPKQLAFDNEFDSFKEAEDFIKVTCPCKFCGEKVACSKFVASLRNYSNIRTAKELFARCECSPEHFTSYEHDKIELEYYEKILAARYNLAGEPHEIHNWLIEIDRSGRMIEDELVSDWQGAFSAVMNYR